MDKTTVNIEKIQELISQLVEEAIFYGIPCKDIEKEISKAYEKQETEYAKIIDLIT